MSKCAEKCMEEFPECCFAYGESDEYSFVMKPDAKVFTRRKDKITTTFVSLFSSSFVFYWKDYFPDIELKYAPIFDGRMVIYPTFKILRDYLSWRQADCHINNLYNTAFWTLVLKGNLTATEAEAKLCVCFFFFLLIFKYLFLFFDRELLLKIRMKFCFLSLVLIIIMNRKCLRKELFCIVASLRFLMLIGEQEKLMLKKRRNY